MRGLAVRARRVILRALKLLDRLELLLEGAEQEIAAAMAAGADDHGAAPGGPGVPEGQEAVLKHLALLGLPGIRLAPASKRCMLLSVPGVPLPPALLSPREAELVQLLAAQGPPGAPEDDSLVPWKSYDRLAYQLTAGKRQGGRRARVFVAQLLHRLRRRGPWLRYFVMTRRRSGEARLALRRLRPA